MPALPHVYRGWWPRTRFHRHPLEVAGLREAERQSARCAIRSMSSKTASEIEDLGASRASGGDRAVGPVRPLDQIQNTRCRRPEDVLVIRDLGDQISSCSMPDLVGLKSAVSRRSCICRMASAWISVRPWRSLRLLTGRGGCRNAALINAMIEDPAGRAPAAGPTGCDHVPPPCACKPWRVRRSIVSRPGSRGTPRAFCGG